MATITITTTAPQQQRLQAAFGKKLNLGRDATGPEIKQQILRFLINVVQEYERQDAINTAIAGLPPPIDPT